MHAHLVQLDIAWEHKAANFARVRNLLAATGVQPGDLIVLPEMFDTGFSFNLSKTNDADGRTLQYLVELARHLGATVHGSRTVIGPDGRGRNRASVVGPAGEVLCEYDKIHPFTYGRESEFFSGGDRVCTYTWTRGTAGSVAGAPEDRTTVCPAICYDLRFPELFRRGLQMGAEVFALGANWPSPRAPHRRALSIARAIENQAYVLCVNRAGRDPHLAYAGASLAIGPRGEVLAEAGEGECVLTVGIDLAALRAWRAEFPAWRDHRLLNATVRS
jgi:predicted amidohydrolase